MLLERLKVLTDAPARLAASAAARIDALRLDSKFAGLGVSAAFHVFLLGAALVYFPTIPLQAPPPEAISVEIIYEPTPEPEAATATSPSPATPAPPAPVPEVVAMPQAPPLPLTSAREIFSTAALDSVARRSLSTLAGDTRFEQLCNVEAMEQIAHAQETYKPERVIAYLTGDTKTDGEMLVANGAAFLSEGHWYRLAYRCRGSRDHRTIVAFDFATGTQIDDSYPGVPSGGDGD